MLKKSFILSALLSVFTFSTSILDASRIKSFKETLSIEENFSILVHPVFKQFASDNPRQVIGLDQIDLDFIKSIKSKYSGLSYREREKKITVHDDECVPQALKVSKFIKIIDPEEKNEKIKDLLDEINFMISKKKVSPVWTTQLSARLAFAMSTPSEDEISLFQHFLSKNSKALLQTPEDLLRSIESILSYSGDLRVLFDRYSHNSRKLWHDDMERLFEMHPATPLVEIVYPILGESYIGIPVLNAFATENVTLMALPTEDKKINAHGVKGHNDKPGASIAAFLSHEALHHTLMVENKSNAFYMHMHRRTIEAVEEGDSAERFFESCMPYEALRYQGIHALLQLAMIGFMEDTLKTQKLVPFKRSMVGQFYMTHEYPGFNFSTFDETSATGVVTNLANATLASFEEVDAWESATDLLQTSPFDGSSSLSNDDIIESFIDHVNQRIIYLPELQRYTYLSQSSNISTSTGDLNTLVPASLPTTEAIPNIEVASDLEKIEDLIPNVEILPTETHSLIPLDEIYKAEVKRSNRYIDILINMNDGNEIKYSYPTYYHKWNNLDGTIGLLAYAGTKVEKPELPDDLEEARKVCAQLLSTTEGLLKEQINYFVEQATQVFNKKNTTLPGHSIEEAYKIWVGSMNMPLEKTATTAEDVPTEDVQNDTVIVITNDIDTKGKR
jgi:hypothetical protein